MIKRPYVGEGVAPTMPSFMGAPVVVGETPNFIETINNRIYFYSDIDVDRILKLNRTLCEMSGQMVVQQHNLSLEEPPPIKLHINSFGGFIFDGLSAMDEIVKIQETVPIHTIVDGACASAATFMSIVGSHRQIKANSFMLIHQLSSSFWGRYSEIIDEKQNLDLLMDTIKGIYKQYTKVPKKKLEEILQHDIWWDAQQCLDYSLVDEII